MSCYWEIDGNVTVPQCKKTELIEIMKDFEMELSLLCEHKNGMSSFIFDFYDERGYSFPDDFATAISPLVIDGDMEVRNDDENTFSLYHFENGKYREVNGEQFIYYPGEEENFIDSLPNAVIDAIKKEK